MLQEEYFQTDEFRETLALYEEACRENRSILLDAADLTDIAEYYFNRNMHSETCEALEQALYLYPHSTIPTAFKAKIVLWEENNSGKALQILELCDDKTMPEYHLTKGEIQLAEGRDENAHQSFLNYVHSLEDEEQSYAALDVLHILLEYQVVENANFWFSLAEELKDSVEYKLIKADILYFQDDCLQALPLYEQLVDSDPFNVHVWRQHAMCMFAKADFAKAIESLNYALAIEPDNKELIFHKAICLFTIENFRDALPLFRQLHDIEPDWTELYYPMGLCLYKEGLADEAVTFLLKAEQANARDDLVASECYGILADLMEDKRDHAKAEYYRKLQQQAEQNIENNMPLTD